MKLLKQGGDLGPQIMTCLLLRADLHLLGWALCLVMPDEEYLNLLLPSPV